MKVLFVGGTGNISSACTGEALRRGYEVFHLNRGTHAEKESVDVRVLKADIRDIDAAKAAVRGFHFDSVVQFLAFRPEHVEADMKIFDGVTDQYVLISSCSAYKKPSLTPIITEETPLENPYWEYARLKIACERVLTGENGAMVGGVADIGVPETALGALAASDSRADDYATHHASAEIAGCAASNKGVASTAAASARRASAKIRESSFPYTIVRPSHTYDDGWIPSCFGSGSYGLAWRMLHDREVIVPGDGQSLWTLTHASDFAVGLVGLLGNAAALGQAFHITSDEHLTWDAIHTIVAETLGARPRIVHIPSDFVARVRPERGAGLLGDKAVSVLFDNSKIRRFVPEFAPRVSFAEGIRRSLAWFDAHPDYKVPDQAMNADIDAVLGEWRNAMGRLL